MNGVGASPGEPTLRFPSPQEALYCIGEEPHGDGRHQEFASPQGQRVSRKITWAGRQNENWQVRGSLGSETRQGVEIC